MRQEMSDVQLTRSSTNIDLEGSKGGAAHDDADDVYYYLICLS